MFSHIHQVATKFYTHVVRSLGMTTYPLVGVVGTRGHVILETFGNKR